MVFITGLLQKMRLFSDMQNIVCHDQVIINPAEFETLQFKIFESLYVTMIGIELTTVIDPARKEPLNIF